MNNETNHTLAIGKGGGLTNIGAIMAAEAASAKTPNTCMEHSGICQQIISVEEKVTAIEKKVDRFFWTLLCSLVGIVVTLLIALLNMSLNERMLKITESVLKAVNP